ncbi:MAG: transposase [Pseudoalteromonas sp.]|nr:transposase [Pseudoalteromonas sp.]
MNACKILPWVHIFISNVKSNIRGTYKGVSSQHLQKYLDEFCYKLNRRFNINQLFNRLLFSCTQSAPITLAELRT